MKTKKGQVLISVVIIAIFLLAVAAVGTTYLIYKVSGKQQTTVDKTDLVVEQITSSGCDSNPAHTFEYTNALTNQAITGESVINFKDVNSGSILGSAASLEKDQIVTPLANASGYITTALADHKVVCGNQQIKGKMYQYANATITIYDDAGTGTIGGSSGTTGNDSTFTVQHNHRIKVQGTAYRSTGRLMIIFEASNTTSVQSITLSAEDSETPLATATFPSCYQNNLTGTPYRVAWEIPAVVGGTSDWYDLQINALNGNSVSGYAHFGSYAEQDAIDSLTGAILKSGICDSNNANTYSNLQKQQWYYNE